MQMVHIMLTVVAGDVVRNVHLPVGPLFPQAVTSRAGVGVPVGLRLDGDVAANQDGLVQVRGCKSTTTAMVKLTCTFSQTLWLLEIFPDHRKVWML